VLGVLLTRSGPLGHNPQGRLQPRHLGLAFSQRPVRGRCIEPSAADLKFLQWPRDLWAFRFRLSRCLLPRRRELRRNDDERPAIQIDREPRWCPDPYEELAAWICEDLNQGPAGPASLEGGGRPAFEGKYGSRSGPWLAETTWCVMRVRWV
jgi:hypothetical protein